MLARLNIILAAVVGFVTLTAAGAAAACCAPPQPPCNCSPPPPPCCGGPVINVPNINVYVAPPIAISVNASASASATSSASAASNSAVYFMGGGGGRFYAGPGAPGIIQNLSVLGGGGGRSSYEATRTRTERLTLRAVCMDDKVVPHPASQVTPDREIADAYDGEIYRCIAGTRMQYVLGDKTYDCQKGDALYHAPGGRLECRKQKPARDCNERSLLRRYGAGEKILTVVRTETYTAYREETTQTASSMSLDGGVGGVVY
ncbi:MAG: hypothetical protein IIZ63_09410 [Caulobacteraceae bacterium]|nr:hypothetical protein [Caulobacteraceae bacterium]